MPRGGPLRGIRVLDASEYVSGPLAGMVLADLGADVVKVERPGKGDAFRTFGLTRNGVSAFWANVNRGKRSAQLDLKSDAGREGFLALAAQADVTIQNTRPGVTDALGVGDDALSAANPRLVRIVVTGYGSTGPHAAEPVFDTIVQAVSGLAAAQGSAGTPETVASMVIDKITAYTAAQAAMAALIERSTTGQGRCVEVAMLDAAAYWNFADVFQDRTFLDDGQQLDRGRSPVLRTADGHLVVAPVSGRQIGRTADAMGRPDWKSELKQIADPTELIDALYVRVESVTSTLPTAEALRRLRDHDVAAGPVHDQDAHLADAQVQHNEIYGERVSDRVGRVRVVRYPARFDGEAQVAPFVLADVGAHTTEVAQHWLAPRPSNDHEEIS